MKIASVLLLAQIMFLSGSAWAARTPFQVRCEDDIGKTVSLLMARANRAQAIAQYYIADASVQRARGASSSALSQAR